MDRLCERPGCSERASVAYGMRPEDLVFWLDALPDGIPSRGGVLCRRHADAMVVPRGWTLDDLRDPDLHLFRPPTPTAAPTAAAASPVVRRRRPGPRSASTSAQLAFDPPTSAVVDEPVPAAPAGALAAEPVAVDADDQVAEDNSAPWTPDFDEADDLDGLLSATSPLLSRAFRTADRA